MESKLEPKPCLWCEKKPMIVKNCTSDQHPFGKFEIWHIQNKCLLANKRLGFIAYKTKKAAIKAWNNQPTEQARAKRIAELKEQIKQMEKK